MSSRKKRAYHSEARNARAAQTRSRVLASAKILFQEEGFEFVTIERLAQAAAVSASMIYSLYRSKCGVLRALIDDALPSDLYNELIDKVKREESAEGRLVLAAKISRQMYDAEKELMDILRGAAAIAPELRELEREREERRHKRQAETVKEKAKEGAFAEGLTLSEIQDILWAFTGRDLYRLMVIERGWSSDTYEAWLAQLLISTLIGRNNPPSPSG